MWPVGMKREQRYKSCTNGCAFLQTTFSNMRLVHLKNSLPSINLLYKRKRNRQKSSLGHNMLVNVCLPTLYARVSNSSDLASEHESIPLSLRGCGPFLQLIASRLSRTRQEGPFVTRRTTTPILHHGDAGPLSWLSTVTKLVVYRLFRKNNKQNR